MQNLERTLSQKENYVNVKLCELTGLFQYYSPVPPKPLSGIPAADAAAPSFSNCFINANCCRSDIGVRGVPDVAAADDEEDGDGEAKTGSSIWVSKLRSTRAPLRR